jgi:ubiquinone/menaquinone biosynthesis C-methylase UbiE
VDAGGGAGAYTAALLEAAPRSTAVLVDMAPVVELARERLRSARVRFVAGDLRETDLGAGHRAALCVNLLHLHPRAVCERILARLRASLAPGGWLAVKDFDVAPDRSGPPEALYFALSMIVFTEGGDVHAPADIAAWMQAAGLEVPARVDLASAPESFVLLARAPPR